MRVCPKCFATPGLVRKITELRPQFPFLSCDFHPGFKGVPIEPVVKLIDVVFRQNYTLGIGDDRYQEACGEDLDTVLQDLTGADDDRVVGMIARQLIDKDPYWQPWGEGPFYSDDYGYVFDGRSLGRPGWQWEIFRQGLLHEGRFFNSQAETLIAEIFDGVQHQRDVDGQGPVYLIKPGEPKSTFLRARIIDDAGVADAIKASPGVHLSPPPERKRRPGRLNPSGVAAFYGAFDLETCVAELRPSVGSVVMASRFAITEPICVLDTTRFSAIPKAQDPFTNKAVERAAQWRFMRSFMYEIAQPISPDDEHLDYIPTQAVAEYLNRRWTFTFEHEKRSIDAILYRSAQHQEGLNIALLGAAAVVGGYTPADDEAAKEKVVLSPSGPAFELSPPRKVRIRPLAGTLETHKVVKARYPTEPLSDLDRWTVDSPSR